MDDPTSVADRYEGEAGSWDRFLKHTAAALAVTVGAVGYVALTDAPANGLAAVIAVIAGGTVLSLLVVMAGYYLLDAI